MPLRALVAEETVGAAAVAAVIGSNREFEVKTLTGFDRIADALRGHLPDVLVLIADLEASALSTIAQVMAQQPLPILVLSAGEVSRDKALTAGAVDVMALGAADLLIARVRLVSSVPVIRHIKGRDHANGPPQLRIVGIAASTGGPHALAAVLKGLRGISAAVLVVQHMHPDFMQEFREWMDRECPLPVQLAVDGAPLEAGRVYLAPANMHLKVGPARQAILDLNPVTLHRPSADILFGSIAEHAGREAVGVLLTGMGADGAEGLLAIRKAGGHTIAQDEASSAVYGMPRVADKLGAAEQVLPLDQIAIAILGAAMPVQLA
jgi:two-component system chemotaxis response regulator CheB